MALNQEKTPRYSVTTPERLRMLCIKKDWFTGGTCEQYERMFRLNDEGKPIIVIAGVIWLCSDEHDLQDINAALEEEHKRYLIQAGQAKETLFLLRLRDITEKQVAVRAVNQEIAKEMLMSAYRLGKVEMSGDTVNHEVEVLWEEKEQNFMDTYGISNFGIREADIIG